MMASLCGRIRKRDKALAAKVVPAAAVVSPMKQPLAWAPTLPKTLDGDSTAWGPRSDDGEGFFSIDAMGGHHGGGRKLRSSGTLFHFCANPGCCNLLPPSEARSRSRAKAATCPPGHCHYKSFAVQYQEFQSTGTTRMIDNNGDGFEQGHDDFKTVIRTRQSCWTPKFRHLSWAQLIGIVSRMKIRGRSTAESSRSLLEALREMEDEEMVRTVNDWSRQEWKVNAKHVKKFQTTQGSYFLPLEKMNEGRRA